MDLTSSQQLEGLENTGLFSASTIGTALHYLFSYWWRSFVFGGATEKKFPRTFVVSITENLSHGLCVFCRYKGHHIFSITVSDNPKFQISFSSRSFSIHCALEPASQFQVPRSRHEALRDPPSACQRPTNNCQGLLFVVLSVCLL